MQKIYFGFDNKDANHSENRHSYFTRLDKVTSEIPGTNILMEKVNFNRKRLFPYANLKK